MVEISKSGSGEGLGGVIPRGYSKIEADSQRPQPVWAVHRPMLYDFGLPHSVIRFKTLHASRASARCPPAARARRPAPMIVLYRKKAFSTRACR